MKIEINIQKKHFYMILLTIILIATSLFVSANWDQTKSLFHTADDIKVTVNDMDYSLQQAIDGNLLIPPVVEEEDGCELLGETTVNDRKLEVITVPSMCKDENMCLLVMRGEGGGNVRLRSTFFHQGNGNRWEFFPLRNHNSLNARRNGDNRQTWILHMHNSLKLLDDSNPFRGFTGEKISGQFTIYDNNPYWSTKVFACPAFEGLY